MPATTDHCEGGFNLAHPQPIDAPSGAQWMAFDSTDALAWAFAEQLTARAAECIARQGQFALALTGGRTPEPLYRRLGQPPWREAIDWTKAIIVFGDERTVAPDHADSNYGMAARAWLDGGPVPAANILRMEGEAPDPAAAASRYAEALSRVLPAAANGMPRIDLVLLGMGDDGHVASLFPGTAALECADRAVAANAVPQHKTTRLTLTYPALDAADEVWMLVTGVGKAGRVAEGLGYRAGGGALPVGRLRTQGRRVVWWLDRAAAGGIHHE
jgi:6-phosphogluconolactonase